jgi:hypothetical protein
MKIEITYVILVLLLFSFNSCAQNKEINLKLKWEVGEKKIVTIKSNGKEFKNGALTRDTSLLERNVITVISENDSAYFVDYRIENNLFKLGAIFYKNIEAGLPGNKFIYLKYRIDKVTLNTQLLNFHDADSIIQYSNDLILKTLGTKVPAKLGQATNQFRIFCKQYKVDVKASSEDFYEMILFPMNKKFVIGDTLTTTDSLSNPFKLQKFKGAEVHTFISKGGTQNNTIDVSVDKTYDFEGYKTMLKEMSNKTMSVVQQAISGPDRLADPLFEMMTALIGTLQLEASENMVISHKLDSSWPSKITKHSILKCKDSQKETSVIVNMTIEIE